LNQSENYTPKTFFWFNIAAKLFQTKSAKRRTTIVSCLLSEKATAETVAFSIQIF